MGDISVGPGPGTTAYPLTTSNVAAQRLDAASAQLSTQPAQSPASALFLNNMLSNVFACRFPSTSMFDPYASQMGNGGFDSMAMQQQPQQLFLMMALMMMLQQQRMQQLLALLAQLGQQAPSEQQRDLLPRTDNGNVDWSKYIQYCDQPQYGEDDAQNSTPSTDWNRYINGSDPPTQQNPPAPAPTSTPTPTPTPTPPSPPAPQQPGTDWNKYIGDTDVPPSPPSPPRPQQPGTDWNKYVDGADAPAAPDTSQWKPMRMGFGQSRVAQNLWGPGAQILSQNGNPDGKAHEGDVVRYTRNGQPVTKQLTAEQALDYNFRSSLVQNCHQYDQRAAHGDKWTFNDNPTPSLTDANGRSVNQNQYWQLVDKQSVGTDGQPVSVKVLELKPGVNAADAVRDLFNNPRQYGMDCATAAHVMNLKATLDTVGEQAFNRRFNQSNGTDLMLYSHFNVLDGENDSGWAPGTYDRPMVPSGDPSRPNSMQNQAYDPSNRNDPLLPGDRRWYVHRGDVHSGGQGWNVISLGRNGNGVEEFWHIPLGNHRQGTFEDTNPGHLAGSGSVDDTSVYNETLTDLRNHPNLRALQQMIDGS